MIFIIFLVSHFIFAPLLFLFLFLFAPKVFISFRFFVCRHTSFDRSTAPPIYMISLALWFFFHLRSFSKNSVRLTKMFSKLLLLIMKLFPALFSLVRTTSISFRIHFDRWLVTQFAAINRPETIVLTNHFPLLSLLIHFDWSHFERSTPIALKQVPECSNDHLLHDYPD